MKLITRCIKSAVLVAALTGLVGASACQKKEEAKKDAPAATAEKKEGEAAKGEAPKAEAPKAEAPKAEAPKAEAPKADEAAGPNACEKVLEKMCEAVPAHCDELKQKAAEAPKPTDAELAGCDEVLKDEAKLAEMIGTLKALAAAAAAAEAPAAAEGEAPAAEEAKGDEAEAEGEEAEGEEAEAEGDDEEAEAPAGE